MEETSYISKIAYDIENMHALGKSEKEIHNEIVKLQKRGKFPENLDYLYSYYGIEGTSGTAFIDKDTGKVTVGFAGTNFDNGWSETKKDLLLDYNILIGKGAEPNSNSMKSASEFLEKLNQNGYYVSEITGHSLGGNIAVLMALKYNVPIAVIYNSAPLYVPSINKYSTGNSDEITGEEVLPIYDYIEKYTGKIIHFSTDKDYLTNISDLLGARYEDKRIQLSNSGKHTIDSFLGKSDQNFIIAVLEIVRGNI